MTVHLTFVTETSDRGFGDWLIGKTEAEDEKLAQFYSGQLPVHIDEVSDLFTAAIIADVILSVEP